jgi:hypothetical protein
MDSNKIKALLVLVVALCGAVYLGISAATAQYETVAWVVGISGLIILLSLGRHVWVVIPIAGALSGGLTFLPGFPQPWYVATPLVAGFMMMRFLMRSNMFQFRWTWLDLMMLAQIVALWQSYVRNPTGLALFGGDNYGGRPYFDYAVAIVSYFLLTIVKTDIKTLKKVIVLVIATSVFDDVVRAISGISGTFNQFVARFYGNVEYQANLQGAEFQFDIMTTRFGGFAGLGLTLCLICYAFRRPLSCILPIPLWAFFSNLIGVILILFSGFRSGLIQIGCFFIASSMIRRRPFDAVAAGMATGMVVLIFGAIFGLSGLPMPVQRALSFLPFDVSDDVRHAAQNSTDWRVEMWKIVLTSDKYIKNKMLGDGFGYSRAEHEAQMKALQGTGHYAGDSIDMFIAKGSYHGWHVEAIRFTGVLGLVIGVFLLFGFAGSAWKGMKHYRGTEYFGYICYICIPILIEPFFHIFVFGSYKSSFIQLIAMAGIVRLIDNIRANELAMLPVQETGGKMNMTLPAPTGARINRTPSPLRSR